MSTTVKLNYYQQMLLTWCALEIMKQTGQIQRKLILKLSVQILFTGHIFKVMIQEGNAIYHTFIEIQCQENLLLLLGNFKDLTNQVHFVLSLLGMALILVVYILL